MNENYYPWLLLGTVAIATLITRSAGPFLGNSRIMKRFDGDVLSRRLPLVILFVLIIKEILPSPERSLDLAIVAKVLAILVVVLLHLWLRNMFVSIIGGTIGLLAFNHILL